MSVALTENQSWQEFCCCFSGVTKRGEYIASAVGMLGEWGVIFRDRVGCGLWTVGRLTCSLERCGPIDKIY